MLAWAIVYTARLVLASLQTSHRRRRDAAAATPREQQSRESLLLTQLKKFINFFNK